MIAPATAGLFETESDPTFGEVVRRHLDIHLVAGKHTDAILAHLAGSMGQYLMIIIEFDAKHCVGQQFHDRAAKFDEVFLSHLPCTIIYLEGVIALQSLPGQAIFPASAEKRAAIR